MHGDGTVQLRENMAMHTEGATLGRHGSEINYFVESTILACVMCGRTWPLNVQTVSWDRHSLEDRWSFKSALRLLQISSILVYEEC